MAFDPLELAYFAGFFDGEGSVGLYFTARRTQPAFRVSLCNNDPRPLNEATRLFGGRVRSRYRKYKDRLTNNYEWYVTGPNADTFLTAIRPYVQIKGEQIDKFLEGRALLVGKGNERGPEYWDAMQMVERELKTMKHLGG